MNDLTLIVYTAVRPLGNSTWRLLDFLVAASVLMSDRCTHAGDVVVIVTAPGQSLLIQKLW